MAEHYFTSDPTSRHEERHFSVQMGNCSISFETDAGTFSKGHLDDGSRLLIDTVPPLSGLGADIGCGWGAMGLCLAAKNPNAAFLMVDVNERAVELAKKNAEENRLTNVKVFVSDILEGVEEELDFCVTNPPIRAGKQTVYAFFTQAHEKLKDGGRLFIVIRKQQGAPSAIKFLQTIYKEVSVLEKDGGFWIVEAVK